MYLRNNTNYFVPVYCDSYVIIYSFFYPGNQLHKYLNQKFIQILLFVFLETFISIPISSTIHYEYYVLLYIG